MNEFGFIRDRLAVLSRGFPGALDLKDDAALLTCGPDEEIVLTALEFRLLTTLIARRGRVQTRDALLLDVWGVQPGLTTRTVDTHVRRLRKKLGDAAAYVETLRGVGYRFTTDATPGASAAMDDDGDEVDA